MPPFLRVNASGCADPCAPCQPITITYDRKNYAPSIEGFAEFILSSPYRYYKTRIEERSTTVYIYCNADDTLKSWSFYSKETCDASESWRDPICVQEDDWERCHDEPSQCAGTPSPRTICQWGSQFPWDNPFDCATINTSRILKTLVGRRLDCGGRDWDWSIALSDEDTEADALNRAIQNGPDSTDTEIYTYDSASLRVARSWRYGSLDYTLNITSLLPGDSYTTTVLFETSPITNLLNPTSSYSALGLVWTEASETEFTFTATGTTEEITAAMPVNRGYYTRIRSVSTIPTAS